MQALKALVIIMGILIILGTVVVAVAIFNRFTRTAESPGAPDSAAAPSRFGEAALPLPEGCRVVDLTAAGERLVVRLGSGRRCEQILVLDLGTGALLGRFTPAPAAQ